MKTSSREGDRIEIEVMGMENFSRIATISGNTLLPFFAEMMSFWPLTSADVIRVFSWSAGSIRSSCLSKPISIRSPAGIELLEVLQYIKGNKASLVDKGNAVTEFFRFVHIMGRQDDGRFLLIQPGDLLPDLVPGLRVESDCRFVEKQDEGMVDKGPDDLKFPSHTPGECLDFHMGTVGQFSHFKEFPDPFVQDTVLDIHEFPIKFKVVIGGEFNIKRTVLRADPDDTADLFRSTDNIVRTNTRRAGGGGEQGGQDPDQGALSRTIGAKEAEDLSPPDLEGDIVDRGYTAVFLAEDL